YPTKKIGLIHSMFRPSDDATVFPFNIPANFFAVHSIGRMASILQTIDPLHPLLKNIDDFHVDISKLIPKHGYINHPVFGKVVAYEINGFGSHLLMDDANVPSVLSLPYLIGEMFGQTIEYKNTRKLLQSENNPFFFKGKAAEGIGGPHVGMDYIWPMSIIMRGLTSTDDKEIKSCLNMLQQTHAGTGFMHESFHKDDATKFTRKWFAWANTLFGEFVWKVYKERPHLLN
ncbi:MAG: glycoside hydrolase family 125 protein, partial [Ferruginibacter sp.]